ncbi:MAG: hypothetical protein HYV33_00960 [Candidatus Kerfeldbacteria bacterium]|nr:hypothetical protein [Candidatus Kerfeldbacteria bacterium]
MFGGMQWVTAAGNEQKITSAKEIITSALAGLIIALLSYTILLFVNPTLVNITLDVSKIDIQQNDDSIYNLPKCSNNKFDDGKTSAANFKDNICIGEDKKDIPCPDIACGHLGFFDGEYCRGDRCESGDGGCYPDPLTPASALSCQLDDCGRWVQDCMTEAKYKKFMIGSSDTKETATRDCVCSYYSMKLLPQVPSIPANYDYGTWGTTYAAAEAAIYKTMGDLCEEKIAGSDWRLNTGVEAAWNCKLGQPAGSTDPIAYEGSGFNCQLATRDAISSSYIASYNIFSIFSQKINTFCYAP